MSSNCHYVILEALKVYLHLETLNYRVYQKYWVILVPSKTTFQRTSCTVESSLVSLLEW